LFFTALNLFATAAFYVINLMPKAFSYRLRLSGNFIRTFNIVMLNCIVMQGAIAQSFGTGQVRKTERRVLKGEKTNQGEEETFKANVLLPVSAGEEGRKLSITLSGSSAGQCTVNGDCFSSLNYEVDEQCTFTMGEDGALNIMLNCIVMQGAVAQSFGAGNVSRTATRRTLKGEKTNQGEEETFKANVLLPVSAGEEGRKLGITLSGSSSGNCAVNGNCFSSLDYGNNEQCTFTMGEDGALNVISFETESNYDELTVGGIQYDGTNGPQGISVSAGEEITWSSDGGITRAGFEICVGNPCVASSAPSDDGSDGNFYCINGGSVGGYGSSCTCTCTTGVGGPNCAICATGYSRSPPDDCSPDPCQATSDSTDDGSDGNFYCINGGDIGGTTGSCTCSSCNTGFGGRSCQGIIQHVVDTNGLFNTVSNENTFADNTGNSIMLNGDTAILAVGSYKCSEGTCASSYEMLYTQDLNGEVKCVEDNASCVLDGENARRGMRVYGTGSGTLILRALTFDKGYADYGGGVTIYSGATVDLKLCIFSNNRAQSAGAINVYSSTVNAYGTSFSGNTADSGDGDDILNYDGTITIHNTCPSPYSSNTPLQGKTRMRIVKSLEPFLTPQLTIFMLLLHQFLSRLSHRVCFRHFRDCWGR
jgi:hypothetical protein